MPKIKTNCPLLPYYTPLTLMLAVFRFNRKVVFTLSLISTAKVKIRRVVLSILLVSSIIVTALDFSIARRDLRVIREAEAIQTELRVNSPHTLHGNASRAGLYTSESYIPCKSFSLDVTCWLLGYS